MRATLATLVLAFASLTLMACGGGAEPEAAPDDAQAPMSDPADQGNTAEQGDGDDGYPPQAEAMPTEAGYPEQAADAADAPTNGEGQDPGAAGEDDQLVVYAVVPDASSASYSVAEEFFAGAAERLGRQPGNVTTVGSTQQVDGQLVFRRSGGTPELVTGTFTVDISTLRSDSEGRDERIRERWLESGLYPIATFEASSLTFPEGFTEGEAVPFELAGTMVIREVSQPVTWTGTATIGDTSVDAEAETMIQMTDYGFEPPNILNLFSVANDVTLTLDVSLQQSSSGMGGVGG